MPSTTSNYGWTYPISSDDLNAGATSVGSLATGVDASLAAEASARAAADSSLSSTKADTSWVSSGLAGKIDVGTFHYGTYVVTAASGLFNLGGYGQTSSIIMDGDGNTSGAGSGHGCFIFAFSWSGYSFKAERHDGTNPGGLIRLNAMGW